MRKLRTGFTLVELLVVMALMAVVATLAIVFFPSAVTSNREAFAAQGLQGWLNIAKQRALRDQQPRGLRLWITALNLNNNNFVNVVNACQYIEQPDDFRGGMIVSVPLGLPSSLPMNPSYKTVNDVLQIMPMPGSLPIDLMNGYKANYQLTVPNPGNPQLPLLPPSAATDPTQKFWTVQPCPFIFTGRGYYPYAPNPQGFGGDYLELYNNGVMHQIVGVLDSATIQVAPPLLNPTNPAGTTNYRIIRSPRVVGTELLTLPEGTFIDLTTNQAFNNPLPNFINLATAEANIAAAEQGNEGSGFIDILFSPSGAVISPGVATSNLHLWVRAPTEDAATAFDAFRGDPTIVSIFVRTGLVGAYQVAPPPAADPYSLVR